MDTELSDDKDIQRQVRYQYCAANKLRASFSRCSKAIKNVLFGSFRTPMYASQLWCNFRKSCMQSLRVAYNFGCRALYNLPWRASVSSHQVQCNIPTFEALLRKYHQVQCNISALEAFLRKNVPGKSNNVGEGGTGCHKLQIESPTHCCSWLHRPVPLTQAQEKDGNSGH